MIDDTLGKLQQEITELKARLIVTEEDMSHMLEIYRIAFMCWYDPEHDSDTRIGNALHPHIKALNDRFHFKR